MKILLLLVIISFTSHLYGQQMIKGKVYDETGDPVTKVTLRDSQKKMLGASDSQGNFNIVVTQLPLWIYCSKIGYLTDSIYLNNAIGIEIVLKQSNTQLQEAVVYSNGFQKLPKERATGSFENLGNDLLKRRISSTIIGQLDGLATGLQFDNRTKSAQLNIRGLNSFSGGNVKPLIVLDNFPFEGTLDQINPNDVEDVTLLKDAAATSIWGARAGNGVIVITTKKATNKFKIDFSSNWTFQPPDDLYYEPIVNSTDFIDLEMMLFDKGHFDNQFSNPLALRKIVLSPVVDLLQKLRLGEIQQDEADRKIRSWRSYDYRKDKEKFYRVAALQQDYIRINSDNTRSDHSVSIGWDRNLSQHIKSLSDRISIRQTNLFDVTDNLQLQANFSYTSTIDRAPAGTDNFFYYPYTRLFDDVGNSITVPYLLNQNYVSELGAKNGLDWTLNPMEDLNKSLTKNKMDHFAANMIARYSIFKGITGQLIYGAEAQKSRNTSLYEESSFFSRNLINQFTQQTNDGKLKYILPKGAIQDRSFSTLMSHRIRAQLDFAKNWTNSHELNILIGTELSHRKVDGNSYRNYGVDADVLTVQKVDYVNPYPTFDNLYGNNYIPFYGSNSQNVQRFLSLFANAAYTFKGKYTISGSMRKDGSNVFGAITNEKWNPLWSTGVAWALAEENFLKDISWISSLKIRATYGTSGNIGGGANRDPIMIYNAATAQYTNYQYGLINTPPNPYLKWEEVQTFNSALEFSMLKNRISGSVEWYSKRSVDLIAPDQIDPTTGFGNAYRNIGVINGRGWDAKLSIASNPNSSLKWNTTFGFSYSKSVVKDYNGAINTTMNYAESGPQILNPILDKELYPVFAYRFEGLDPQNGDPQGSYKGEVSKDYQKLLNDSLQNLHYYGSALPSHYGFLRGMLGWKKLQFTFSINYKFGHYFRKRTVGYAGMFNGTAGHGDFYQRWQNPGDEKWTNIPSMIYPANTSRDNFYKYAEPNVLKGDVIRLQDLRLSYSFAKIPIQVNASVNNVGILWKANKKGLDPDYFSTPPSRIYSFGINVNF